MSEVMDAETKARAVAEATSACMTLAKFPREHWPTVAGTIIAALAMRAGETPCGAIGVLESVKFTLQHDAAEMKGD